MAEALSRLASELPGGGEQRDGQVEMAEAVAAAIAGHQHLLVQKQSTKDSTTTRLKELNKEERVEEIARMLSGLTVSEQSLAHAREMLV